MVIIKIVIGILIFINAQFLVRKINSVVNKNISEARGEESKYGIKKQIYKIEIKALKKDKILSILEKKKRKMIQQGNPMNLSVYVFYMFKITPVIVVALFFISVGVYNIPALLVLIIIYNAIDLLYYFSNLDDNKRIIQDLPNIYDVLNIQSTAGVNIGMALTEVFEAAKSKRFKATLMTLSAEINLTKSIEKALDNFNDKFNLMEIDSFVLAIKQSIKSGRCRELLSNQSEIMKENNLLEMSEKTKEINVWIMIVGVLMFIGISAIIILSFKDQIGSSLNNIF